MHRGRAPRGPSDEWILSEQEADCIRWLRSTKNAFIVMLCALWIYASSNGLTMHNVKDVFTREMEEAAESVKMYVCGSKGRGLCQTAMQRHETVDSAVTDDVNHLRLFGTLVGVYDGDTIKIDMENMPPVFGHRLSVRLAGIDAPEIRGSKCPIERCLAIRARSELCRWLGVPDCVIGSSSSSSSTPVAVDVVLTEAKRGKYFRLVARVSLKETEQQLDASENMLAGGWAVPYDGKGKRHDWCSHEKLQPTKKIAKHVRECAAQDFNV